MKLTATAAPVTKIGHMLRLIPVELLAMAGCAEPATPIPRNVVIVSLDALGAGHTGAYGYERDTTPVLDRVAGEGVVFENAYTQQVWTLTSHLTLMTGLYPKAHGAAADRAARPEVVTLAQLLRSRGFRTAAFTGVGGYMKPGFGLGRGFETYRVGSPSRLDNRRRLRWLEVQAAQQKRDPEHRFFLFAHYFDIHSTEGTKLPYSAPKPCRFHFLPEGLGWTRRGDTQLLVKLWGKATPRDRHVITALYDGAVRRTDLMGLGVLLAKLRGLGLYDETLLVVTSDHGEEIYEHGAPLHIQPYEPTARVPLVMRGPGIPVGMRVPDLVELLDVTPTVLARLGLEIPGEMQGFDLSPLLRGGAIGKQRAFTEGIKTLRGGKTALTASLDGERWSYVALVMPDEGGGFRSPGKGELYLLDTDPDQGENLQAERPELAAQLNAELLAWYAENARRAEDMTESEEAVLSDEERAQLEALGYVE